MSIPFHWPNWSILRTRFESDWQSGASICNMGGRGAEKTRMSVLKSHDNSTKYLLTGLKCVRMLRQLYGRR